MTSGGQEVRTSGVWNIKMSGFYDIGRSGCQEVVTLRDQEIRSVQEVIGSSPRTDGRERRVFQYFTVYRLLQLLSRAPYSSVMHGFPPGTRRSASLSECASELGPRRSPVGRWRRWGGIRSTPRGLGRTEGDDGYVGANKL